MLTPTDLEFAEELRFVSDLYDIGILSTVAGINKDYFTKASSEWRALSENSFERNLLNSLIPDIEFIESSNIFIYLA